MPGARIVHEYGMLVCSDNFRPLSQGETEEPRRWCERMIKGPVSQIVAMGAESIREVRERYEAGEQIAMLTAYDAEMARLVEAGGVDMILVGDSAADNHHGYEDTLGLTLEEALSNTAAVNRGIESTLVIADLPFLSYGTSTETSIENAGRFIKEAGADAVKLETAPHGDATISLIDQLTELGIPVQGHIGYTPQHVRTMGGAVIQGRDEGQSSGEEVLLETAQRLVDAGVFSIVLETVTEDVAKTITEAVDVPTIGIGAGRYVDGQVLVLNDVIGLGTQEYTLAKAYANVGSEIEDAVATYVSEVQSGEFPTVDQTFDPID